MFIWLEALANVHFSVANFAQAIPLYEQVLDLVQELEMPQFNAIARITSYNVCYTKLLRNEAKLTENRQASRSICLNESIAKNAVKSRKLVNALSCQ